MSETKFTPGPWHVGNQDIYADGSDGDDLVICAIGQAGGFRSAEFSVVRGKRSAAEANAHLIAAAPDLYDFLATLCMMRGIRKNYPGLVEHSEKALAKARGEA